MLQGTGVEREAVLPTSEAGGHGLHNSLETRNPLKFPRRFFLQGLAAALSLSLLTNAKPSMAQFTSVEEGDEQLPPGGGGTPAEDPTFKAGVEAGSEASTEAAPNPLEAFIPNIGAEVSGVSPALIRPVTSPTGLNKGFLNPDGSYTLSVRGASNSPDTFASLGTPAINNLAFKDGVFSFQANLSGDNPLRGNAVVNFGLNGDNRHRLSFGGNGVFLAQRFEGGKVVSELFRTRLDGVDLTQVQDVSILKSGELTQVFMGGILEAEFSDNTPDTWNKPSFALNRGGAVTLPDGTPDNTEVKLNIISLKAYGLIDAATQPTLAQKAENIGASASIPSELERSDLPPFLWLDKEMAGAAYDLRVLNKPIDRADPKFFENPENYRQDLIVPYQLGIYDLVFRIDKSRVYPGSELEVVAFARLNGEWVRSGDYVKFNATERSSYGFYESRIIGEKARNDYWLRIKSSGKTAMVQKYSIQ